MNSDKTQLRQPSRSTRPAPLATAAGHLNQPREPAQTDGVNPLHTLIDLSMARARPYPHFHPTQPLPNTSLSRASPAQSSSLPLSRDDTRPIPSKRARDYTTNPRASYHTSLIPSSSNLSLDHTTRLSSERPAKRPRLGVGRPSTVNRGSSQMSVPPKPSPLSQPPMVGPTPPRPRPKPKKAPFHPLPVDYGRPLKPVVPQPPFCRMNLRQNRIPLPPYPEIPDAKCLLEEELKGPVDPAVAKDLGDLTWRQQKRVWNDVGGYSDPFLRPIDISLLDARSSRSCGGVTPVQSRQEVIALYGPPSRNNESTRLGEPLTNPNAIASGDDEDGRFGDVLDLYCSAIQGSTLSMELELAVWGDVELAGASWETASSLEVSIERRSSTPTPSGESQESRIRTLAEYRQVVEVEKAVPLSKPVTVMEEPPLGIEWAYSCCGYSSGKVVDVEKATVRR